MKKNELKKIREKTLKQLRILVEKNKLELMRIKSKVVVGKEKDFKKTKNLKREIAQTLTIIREKELIEKVNLEKETNNKEQRKKKKLTGWKS